MTPRRLPALLLVLGTLICLSLLSAPTAVEARSFSSLAKDLASTRLAQALPHSRMATPVSLKPTMTTGALNTAEIVVIAVICGVAVLLLLALGIRACVHRDSVVIAGRAAPPVMGGGTTVINTGGAAPAPAAGPTIITN